MNILNTTRGKSEVGAAKKALANVGLKVVMEQMDNAMIAIIAEVYPDAVEAYKDVFCTPLGKAITYRVIAEIINLLPEKMRELEILRLTSETCKINQWKILIELVTQYGKDIAPMIGELFGNVGSLFPSGEKARIMEQKVPDVIKEIMHDEPAVAVEKVAQAV